MNTFSASACESHSHTQSEVYRHVDTAVNTETVNSTPESPVAGEKCDHYVSIPSLQFGQVMARMARNKDHRTKKARGYTFAKVATYAKMFKRSRRTVTYWIAQLEAAGYIVTEYDARKRNLYIYPQVPERVFIALLLELPEADPLKVCPEIAHQVAHQIAQSPSRSSITTLTKDNNNTERKTRKEKPEPVSAQSVAVPEMNNEELETVHLLVTETIPAETAKAFVTKLGSPLTLAILQDYRKRRAEGRARGTGRLIYALNNPHTLETASGGTNTPRFDKNDPYANPERSRKVTPALQEREKQPTPPGEYLALREKMKKGSFCAGYTNREGLKQ